MTRTRSASPPSKGVTIDLAIYRNGRKFRKMITKLLVSGAIVVGAILGAAPASADNPSQPGTDPNPFAALTANSPRTAPPSPVQTQEIDQGIWAGLAG
jgi:hypothetical protein